MTDPARNRPPRPPRRPRRRLARAGGGSSVRPDRYRLRFVAPLRRARRRPRRRRRRVRRARRRSPTRPRPTSLGLVDRGGRRTVRPAVMTQRDRRARRERVPAEQEGRPARRGRLRPPDGDGGHAQDRDLDDRRPRDGARRQRHPDRQLERRLESTSSAASAPRCSIASGQATEPRGRLVRREALEVALYTFKFVPSINSIVAFMPPPPGSTADDAPLPAEGRRSRSSSPQPLDKTLPLATPPLPTAPDPTEKPRRSTS